MFTGARNFAITAGGAVAIALIGGLPSAHAEAAAPSAPAQPGVSQQTSSQTLVLDPTKSFALRVSPTVKATPFWGEPKAG